MSQNHPGKMKNRRRFYRGFFQPRFQMKYGMYYAAIAVVSVLVFNGFAVYFLVSIVRESMIADPTLGLSPIFVSTLSHNRVAVAAGLGSLFLLYFSLAFIFTKTIVGPTRVLVRHVEELKRGNYDHKSSLRRRDELRALLNSMNELSDILKNRHGSSSEDFKSTGS
jgi:HAMP domain-containing protein